jgi:hypothetical protein
MTYESLHTSRDERQGSAQRHTALLADLLYSAIGNDAGQFEPCCRPHQHLDLGADTSRRRVDNHSDLDFTHKLSAGFN